MYIFYVKVKGTKQGQFKGESSKTDRKSKNFIECHGFEMSSKVAYDVKSAQIRGSREHLPLELTKQAGVTSCQFLQAHYKAEKLSEVVIEFVQRSPDGSKEEVRERVTLKNAFIVTQKRGTVAEGQLHSDTTQFVNETYGLVYEEIDIEAPLDGLQTTDSWTMTDKA